MRRAQWLLSLNLRTSWHMRRPGQQIVAERKKKPQQQRHQRKDEGSKGWEGGEINLVNQSRYVLSFRQVHTGHLVHEQSHERLARPSRRRG